MTALTDASGTVQERFLYDPYGHNLVLDEDFAVDSDGKSDYDWEYRFTSREYDTETGLHYFRARYWHPTLGRFIGRDPLEYIDGGSLYDGYFVPAGLDPWGLADENLCQGYYGGWFNPINWGYYSVYGATKTYGFDFYYGNYHQSNEGRKTQEYQLYLDGHEGVHYDELRRSLHEQNKHPIPGAYNDLLQDQMVNRAGAYGGAFGYTTPRSPGFHGGGGPSTGNTPNTQHTGATGGNTPPRPCPSPNTPPRFVSGPSGNTVDLKPTIDRINSGGTFPHRNDGSIFGNREGRLPQQPQGYYHEYVHPTPGVNGPGAQRVVTGQNGEMYYTPDHYGTFIPLSK